MGILDAPGASLAAVRRRTRRAGFPFATPTTASGVATVTEAQIRSLVKVPVTSTRWRFHLRNWQPRNGTTIYPGAISVTGVWLGDTAFTTGSGALVGRPSGAFAATPTLVLPAFTTPADGSEYISPWVTDSTMQVQSGRSHLLSYGFTKSAGSIATGLGTYCFLSTAVGSSLAATAGASALASGMAQSSQLTYFDGWIEYEWTGSEPVGLALGDSLTAGFGQPSTTNTVQPIVYGNDQTQTWPAQLAMLTGSPLTAQGISGLTLADIPAATNPAYTKWTHINEGYIPDYAVVFLGSNDTAGLQAVSSTNGYVASIVANLRGMGIPRIYFLTIPVRTQLNGATTVGNGSLAAAAAAGDTSITTTFPLITATKVDIDWSLSQNEAVTTSAASTGTGPYVTALTAALVNAHPVGATVWSYQDTIRRQLNTWLRRKPFGIDGVISIDRHLSEVGNPFALATEWAASDGVHLTAGGYAIIAQEVAPVVIALKL